MACNCFIKGKLDDQQKLDEIVFATHRWKSDLTDGEILEKLPSLNKEELYYPQACKKY